MPHFIGQIDTNFVQNYSQLLDIVLRNRMQQHQTYIERIQELFNGIDVDQNQVISVSEFKLMMDQ